MGRRASKAAATVAIVFSMLACAGEHPNQAAWDAFYDGCVSDGFTELSDNEDFDPEDDVALVEDVCSEVVQRLTEESPDALPSEISNAEKDEAFEEAFDDCLNQDLLESEYC